MLVLDPRTDDTLTDRTFAKGCWSIYWGQNDLDRITNLLHNWGYHKEKNMNHQLEVIGKQIMERFLYTLVILTVFFFFSKFQCFPSLKQGI